MYLTLNILRLRYKPTPVNASWGKSRYLLWEPYGSHRYTVCVQNVGFVPQRIHITSPIQSPTGECCFGKQSMFIVRNLQNSRIHFLGRIWRFYLTGNILILRYKDNRLMLFGERVNIYCENHTGHNDTLCEPNVSFVTHRKHITSPLQWTTD
jgi:hypothetical protein